MSSDLIATARAMVAEGKGVLAADESNRTATKRLESVGVESTEESRRAYRELLVTAPGLGEFVSGVILYDETIRQTTHTGDTFPIACRKAGIIPGIKVDTGAQDLAGAPGEQVTEGLDGLRGRLAEYWEMGARFAKWRAVITIGEGIPSPYCIAVNAHALARYAALCQEAGIVPIVEPEVLMDGDHSMDRCEEVTTETLHSVFGELLRQRVELEGMILKPNMVISGKGCPDQAAVEDVAEATVRTMRRVVPAAVPGIAFLSGGQSDELATAHLNAINNLGSQPWELTFSYARALQGPALKEWKGESANVPGAQAALLHRARCNSAARSGAYLPDMEHSQ